MKTAIFLGAGASAAEGASIQSELFKDYFKLIKKRGGCHSQHESILVIFFQLMFDVDIMAGNIDEAVFPTFEEALGILDLADLKDEAFKDFANINFAPNSGQIKFLRLYLVFLMADIINENLQKGKGIHKKLIDRLKTLRKIDDTIFITTNYDILCDNALLDLYEEKEVNYGVEFVNHKEGSFLRSNHNSIKLFKLHGSLNWLYCPTCNNLRITPYEKGVYNLMIDPTQSYCIKCNTIYSPIIVPPTFYKNLSKFFLGQVWNKAETELLDAEHLIFCGYSFPDADIHVKYLIKRIQKNRVQPHKLKITVINNYIDKLSSEKVEEKKRYTRFLGQQVNYTSYSFEEFANNPNLVM
ncbi:MAG: SIR2 family protein [Ferruginibacter sp.]